MTTLQVHVFIACEKRLHQQHLLVMVDRYTNHYHNYSILRKDPSLAICVITNRNYTDGWTDRQTDNLPYSMLAYLHVVTTGGLKMQDREMEDNIWGKVRRWKMQDWKMEEQIWGQGRR